MKLRAILLAGVASIALAGCAASTSDSPAPGNALTRVADRLAANGDTSTAVMLYRSAIALGQKSPETRRSLGNALLTLGDAQGAAAEFEAALAEKKDPRAYNGLGIAFDMLGDHERAQGYFRDGLALDPNHRGLMHNYGLSLAAAEKSDSAEKPADIAAATAPPKSTSARAASATEEEVAIVAPPMRASEPRPIREIVPARTAASDAPRPVTPRTVAAKATVAETIVTETSPAPSIMVAVAMVSEPPAPSPEPEPAASAAEEPMPLPRHEIVPLRSPVSAAPLHGSYFRFRLAGFISRDAATQSWRELAKRAPELQGALYVVAERPSLGARAGLRYSLMSAPLPNLRAAEWACDALIERGVACTAEPFQSALAVRS